MKQNRIIKIFLILAIIIIACCIKTTSYASVRVEDNTTFEKLENAITKQGGISLSYTTATKNPYIFCRELGEPFLRDRNITYKLESGPEENINNQKSYLFNSSAEYTGNNSMRESKIQQLWWCYLGEGFSTEENRLILKAAERYKTYGESLTRYYGNYNKYTPTVDINTEAQFDNEGNCIIGLIKIPDYPYDSNLEFGGIDGVELLNDENKSITHTLLENDKKTVFSEMSDLNKNAKNGFYIKISKNNFTNTKSVKLRFHYKYLATRSKIYYIYTDEKTPAGYYTCEEHKDANIEYCDKKKYIANTKHSSSLRYYYDNDNAPNTNSMYYIDGYYRKYYSVDVARYICVNGHIATNVNGSSQGIRCPTCGTTQVKSVNKAYGWQGYNLFNCNNCGWKEGSQIQKLVIASHDKESGGGYTESFEISVIPQIDITLQKYDSQKTNVNLTGAQFTIEARQNKEKIQIQNFDKDGKLITIQEADKDGNPIIKAGQVSRIKPNGIEPIYVQIKEKRAPNGHIKINEPINMIYVYSETRNNWDPIYIPSQENWNESGFTTLGTWSWDKENDADGTTKLPNAYKSTKGDRIIANGSLNNGKVSVEIKVYDEPVIERVELLKIDGIDNKINLAGAKFKATITNVKSMTVGGEEIPLTETNSYTFTTNKDGKFIATNLKLIDVDKNVNITITEIEVPASNTQDYYYEKLSGDITITLKYTPTEGLTNLTYKYGGQEKVTVNKNGYAIAITVPNKRLINLSGKVWLDGNTGIKPVVGPNGKIDSSEEGMAGIKVELLGAGIPIDTRTNNNGEYQFKGLDYGPQYSVKFTYDGINYEDTTYYKNEKDEIIGDSKAQESAEERNNFNNKFTIIEKGTAKNSSGENTVKLDYNTDGSRSILNTHNTEDKSLNINDFGMNATISSNDFRIDERGSTVTTKSLNLGLIKRGTDLALSTDVYDAKVTINGKEADYNYNHGDNTIEIGSNQTFDNTPKYNLYLDKPDYYYRIRDYVSNETFKEVQNKGSDGMSTGDELKVYVTYKINLQNQSTKNAYINKVAYKYDEKYTFNQELTDYYNRDNFDIDQYDIDNSTPQVLNINFEQQGRVNLTEGQTKTLYLVFEVNKVNGAVQLGDFTNTAEITSYSTDEGFIDVDSAPGNCAEQHEDDCDKSGGLTIQLADNKIRTITGKVFDKTDSNKEVNGVIVQLIEVKEINGNYYEYIWQETVSGNGIIKKMSIGGDTIETSTIDGNNNGAYTFKGYIPGNYIIRFIYGDGTTYNYVGANNETKTINTYDYIHNGQDYKSVADAHYSAEWYNKANYTPGDSIARDNEARRLETIANYVEIDGTKGVALKLLNKQTNLNNIEAKLLENGYGTTDVESILNNAVLPNTWMCAESSKVDVTVDGENASYEGMNLGLEKRPETKIKLEKKIKGLKITASNAQTIINAYQNADSVIEGIKDNLQVIPGTTWLYSVSPTEINTVVDGAQIEFVYDIIVTNESSEDYLGTTLANAYNNNNAENYIQVLNDRKNEINNTARQKGYNSIIGTYLGEKYYKGDGAGEAVKTEVTSIRDYVNNDLEFMAGTTVKSIGEISHYVADDKYVPQEATIKTVLETTETTGKLGVNESTSKYEVTLGKNPISSTGKLDFENYIAEVMSFTNAAGRRTVAATPGNAGVVNKLPVNDEIKGTVKELEIDEATAEKIQIGQALGEDEQTNYIWLTAIVAGIAVIAIGAFVTKKYIIKK